MATVARPNSNHMQVNKSKSRIVSIDLLRGIIMVLMALDHVRNYMHNSTTFFSPTNLAQTTASLFLTRWVTHFCAPLFVFLSGVGAFFYYHNGRTKKELTKYLLIRGFMLILLEITLNNFIWTLGFETITLQVLWALGWSMIVLSIIVHFPDKFIAIFSIGIISGHNLLDGIRFTEPEILRTLWKLLHISGGYIITPYFKFYICYPIVPWIGVISAGYLIGTLFLLEKNQRSNYLIKLGLTLTISFVVLRTLNLYGDPNPWTIQSSYLFTVLSFLNCEKYPPSLLFLLMTLGPGILFLGFEIKSARLLNPLIILGKTPLFYYFIHIPIMYMLHLLFAKSHDWNTPIGTIVKEHHRFDLLEVYLFWVVLVICVYLPCRWYSKVKTNKSWAWLKYL